MEMVIKTTMTANGYELENFMKLHENNDMHTYEWPLKDMEIVNKQTNKQTSLPS